MKPIYKIMLLLACMMTSLSSCEWDNSPDPEHPWYVTYTISTGILEFDGPELLLADINAWIKANQVVYDKEVNYTTGQPSEFAKTDEAAAIEYTKYVPKFASYLNEVRAKLAAGDYGEVTSVTATFYTFAARTQGQGGNLKYDQVKFSYP